MAGMEKYFAEIEKKVDWEYKIANAARAKGYDAADRVEISKTADLAERVESLVGPLGVAPRIRELLKQKSREDTCFNIMNEIIEGKYGGFKDAGKLAEQAVRTGTTILTEGVTAAGTEGISKLKICENPDGTKYLSIYLAGPIRSAGGTSAALTVLLTDYARKLLGLQTYVPTETEVERYVEEIGLYQTTLYARQYKMSDDEIRFLIKNCPVCIDGEPTEEMEVTIYKRVPRVETSRIRGGMALVATEGFGLKAAKLLKFSRKHNLGWDWLENMVKIGKRGKVFEAGAKPIDVYLGDIVGGRPIFAYPSVFGGFRLRYGRARNSGINGRGIHPATMYILEEFPAVGTQFKVEQPGKGCSISPCDTIEPPVVLLKNGDVCAVSTVEKAKELQSQVEKILFLGDILTSYGDFLKSGNPLLPPGFCEEWWEKILKEKKIEIPKEIDSALAIELAEKQQVPLHPKYTYFYKNTGKEELFRLKKWLDGGSVDEIETLGGKKVQRIVLENSSPDKQILEKLCIPHKVREGRVIIEDSKALLRTLKNVDGTKEGNALEIINATCGFPVHDKAGTFIGARMGRPEKAKERHMAPAPNGIVPLGEAGGRMRSVAKAMETEKFVLDMPELVCPECNGLVFGYFCRKCGKRAHLGRVCVKCGGRSGTEEKCGHCGETTLPYSKIAVNFRKEANAAASRIAERIPGKAKGVEGVINPDKFFEPLEKCILRAKHGVHVFKDGTIRFDATNLPVTHFRPCEIGTPVERLRQLGYAKDYLGNDLKSETQIVELFPQDILPSETGSDCFVGITKFVDDLLEKFYGLPRYYNACKKEDLVGHYVIGIAPHISVGIVGRIIGFTKARVGYAHPYFHCAQRRDADGDENSIMFLLDALLNFSRSYLPTKRGGSMDAPMVINIKLDPTEIDDQVHAMETVSEYPLALYESAVKRAGPADVAVEIVQHRLAKENQYFGLGFTHDTARIDEGPACSRYTQLKSMEEKVNCELELAEKINAVDKKDMAARILNFHFLRDIYGNLRAFGEQKFRCVECNAKYRRIPLSGKCNKCGGKLLLTVNYGGIKKYLEISKQIAEKYGLGDYLKQRLGLIEKDLALIFKVKEEPTTQKSLADFI